MKVIVGYTGYIEKEIEIDDKLRLPQLKTATMMNCGIISMKKFVES